MDNTADIGEGNTEKLVCLLSSPALHPSNHPRPPPTKRLWLMHSKSTRLYTCLHMLIQVHHLVVMPSINGTWRPSDLHDLFQSPAMPPVALELLQEPLKPGTGIVCR